MQDIEIYALNGICKRLVHVIPAEQDAALIVARWIADQPHVFGTTPSVAPAGRHKPGVDPLDWRALGEHLAVNLQQAHEPFDQSLDRLHTITAHLGLGIGEEAILRFLLLQQRTGPIGAFASLLKHKIGISDEAVIAWCCNLDEAEVWHALAPQGPLVMLGLVQSDSSLPVMRDDPYTFSGLLRVLLQPPRREQGAMLADPRDKGITNR